MPTDPQLDEDLERSEAWDRVAEQRDAEIEAGEVSAVDGDAAVVRLRSRYQCPHDATRR